MPELRTICPAGLPVGESRAGRAILCRITGRVVAERTDPSSLEAFCCNREASVRDATANGELVAHGYTNCPVWLYNRRRELGEPDPSLVDAPQRVREALRPEFVSRSA